MSQMDSERARLALGDANSRLLEAETKLKAGKASAAADMRARERKLEKISTDIATAQKGLDSLQVVAPADGTVSIMQNYRAGSMMGPSPEFRQGDRAWAGAQILELPDSDVGARRRAASTSRIAASSRRARPPYSASTRFPIANIRPRSPTSRCSPASTSRRAGHQRRTSISSSRSPTPTRGSSPGMSAVARIAVGRIPDQILVPPAAIFTSEGQTGRLQAHAAGVRRSAGRNRAPRARSGRGQGRADRRRSRLDHAAGDEKKDGAKK
jgi:multidrug efflux pump subunit AcrA (membrane-fusion protein)